MTTRARSHAIEDAIARGDKGILITPMSTGVNAAITKARDAGLFVIALDTPPDPADTVDITFATDNRRPASSSASGLRRSSPASRRSSPCSTSSTTRSSRSTTTATRASSRAWASTSRDPKKNGDEPKTGKLHRGRGGTTSIVCNEAGHGDEAGGRSGHGEVPRQEPRHQRRLHDQRADGCRCQRRLEGGRARRRRHRRLGRRWVRRRRERQERRHRRDRRSSTRSRWRPSAWRHRQDRPRWREAGDLARASTSSTPASRWSPTRRPKASTASPRTKAPRSAGVTDDESARSRLLPPSSPGGSSLPFNASSTSCTVSRG